MAEAGVALATTEAGAQPCERAVEEGLLAQPPAAAFGVESDEGSSSASDRAEAPARGFGRLRRHRKLAAAAVGSALLLGCVGVGAGLRRQPAAVESHNVDDSVELGALASMISVMGSMAAGVKTAAELTDGVSSSYNAAKGIMGALNNSSEKFEGIGGKLVYELEKGPRWRKELKKKFMALNATQKEKVKQRLLKRFNITSLKQLRPKEQMHDGNVCQDDEEEHMHLCYKKCSLLTGGHFPYRVSAWECCQHGGLCPTHFKIDFRLCGGFGVSGDQAGAGCPHSPGGCLKTEELYGNFCYKKCSLLTYGVLSSRAGPSTCCQADKAHDWLAFLDADGCDTKESYYQGGGKGDGDYSTPQHPHMPMTSLTEASI